MISIYFTRFVSFPLSLSMYFPNRRVVLHCYMLYYVMKHDKGLINMYSECTHVNARHVKWCMQSSGVLLKEVSAFHAGVHVLQ